MKKHISDFRLGFLFVLNGFSELKKRPHLKKWFLIPFLIYIFIIAISFSLFSEWVPVWVGSGMSVLNGLTSIAFLKVIINFLYYPILILLWLAFGVISFYIIFTFGTIFASPFNALLAEKLMVDYGKVEDQDFKLNKWISFTLSMLWVSLKKMFLFSVFGIIIFIISMLPGLNIIAIFLAMMIMAFDSLDYSFEALGWSLKRRLDFFRSHLACFMGMTTFFTMTLVLPGAILFILPLSVLGGSYVLNELINSDSN